MSGSAPRATAVDLDLTPAPRGGTRIRLRVKPGARRSAVVGVHGGTLKVAVAAPPERGKANRSVVALLAEILDVPEAAVTIVAGETKHLNYDPLEYFREMDVHPDGKDILGVRNIMRELKSTHPKIKYGYFNPYLSLRGRAKP